MTTERDILQQIANQVAPGSSVRDPETFTQFLQDKDTEFRNFRVSQDVVGIENRLRQLGQEPVALPPGSSPRDIFFERSRQLAEADPEIRAQNEQSFRQTIFGLNPVAASIGQAVSGLAPGGASPGQIFEPQISPTLLGEGTIGRTAAELTSPADVLLTAVTAGAGPAIAGGLRGAGRGGRAAANLFDPVLQGSLPTRLAAETAVGAGAIGAAVETGERLPEGTLPPVRIAAQLGAGVLGGVGAAGGIAGARGAARAVRQQGTDLLPVGTAQALDEGVPVPSRNVELTPDIATSGTVRPTGVVSVPEQGISLFGIRAPDVGLSRQQILLNQVRNKLPQTNQEGRALGRALGAVRNEIVDPVFKVREEMIRNAKSRAVATSQRIGPAYRRVFEPDENGLITSLAGVDPELPIAPTIQDVAARLPRFIDRLTPEQRQFVENLRAEMAPFEDALRQAGDDFGQRTDIIEGGFYLPRGGTLADGADAPLLPSGTRRPGSTPGFLRSASRASMAESIAAGDQYLPFEQALGSGFIERTGRRVADRFTSNYLSTVRDADGTKFGLTAKELLMQQNPRIVTAMGNLRARVQRLQSLVGRKTEQLDEAAGKFLDDPAFSDVKHLDDLDAALERINLISAVQTARREADRLRPAALAAESAEPRIRSARNVTRGPNQGQQVTELRAEIRATRELIRRIKPQYERQLRSVTRGRGPIGPDALDFPQLNGRTFPERMAARANELIQQDRQTLGGLDVVNEAQNIFKGMQATLDDSGVGIQALLSGFSRSPLKTAKAVGVNIRSFKSPDAMADYLQGFNQKAVERGLPSAEQWTDSGLRQLAPGDFDLTSTLPENIPGVGRAFRGANRAFATISNVVRLGWAEDLLMEEIAKGRTLDEVATDGTLQRISRHANTATGVVDGNFSVANLITFSARFLASRLATISRAIRGIDIDAPVDAIPVLGPRLARRIPDINPAARLEDRLARRAILRMMAFGTMLTVALNQVQGEDTDFRPVVDGRPNSNFMRFRWGRRDWSLFGPWDSILRIFTSLGTGNVKATTRSLASSPGASLALDFVENKDFFGREIVDRDGNFTKQSADVLARFAETTIPFSASEAPELLEQIARNNEDGHLQNLGETGLTALGEAFGVKSSPLSSAEMRELLADPNTSPETRRILEQELAERRASFRSSASERLVPFIEQQAGQAAGTSTAPTPAPSGSFGGRGAGLQPR